MNKERVIQYTQRWVTAKQLEEEKAKNLMTTMKECLDDPQIQPLTTSPLQVTILTLIILTGGTPPRQREALFDEYLEIIYRREKTKAKWIMQTEKRLLFGLHKYLGYVLHERAAGKRNVQSVIKEVDFIKAVRTYLSYNDKYSNSAKFEDTVEQIVKEARERLVLIVELEAQEFGFEVRSLQEFFASAHLADTAKNTLQRYQRFKSIARSDHWRNVALLFAGRVGRSYEGEAAIIIEVCKEIDRPEPEKYLKAGAWLGLEIAADRCFVPNRNLQRSVIEYSLSLLDGVILVHERDLVDALKKLQNEDLLDHVKPLLEEKMQSYRFPAATTIINIYFELFSITDKLLEQLESFLFSKIAEQTKWALEKSLEYKVAPRWLADKVPKVFDSLTPVKTSEIFVKPIIADADYVKTCLEHCKFEDEKLSAITNNLLPNVFRNWYQVKQTPEISGLDVSTPEAQMWTEAKLMQVLAYLRNRSIISLRRIPRGVKQPFASDWYALSQIMESVSQAYLCAIDKQLPNLTVDKSVSTRIKYCLWILKLSSNPYTKPTSRRICRFLL